MTMKRCFLSLKVEEETYEMILNLKVGEERKYARISGIPHKLMGQVLERLSMDYEALEASRESASLRRDG